jgi:hypothetical protein
VVNQESLRAREPLRAFDIASSKALSGRHSAADAGVKAGQAAGSGTEEGHPDAPDTVSVKDLALGLPNTAWRTIKWREGSNEWLSSRFARLLVHVASSHQRAGKPTKEWLLIEWPEGEKEPTKCWLSTLPNSIYIPRSGRRRQAALAHRARLSGAQAGGRARAL